MAIAAVNYPAPILVNGYSCRNCGEVDLAKKNIDPAHPGSGVAGRDAAKDATRPSTDPVKIAAARRLAEAARADVTRYSPAGAGLAAPAVGSIVSLSA